MRWTAILPSFGLVLAGGALMASENETLTAIPGIKVGHMTLSERPTGCTVILAEGGAVGGVDVRGGAPATRETDLLDPVNTVQTVHAVVLSGGSAYGLDSATGVMGYLEGKGIGVPVGVGVVPIVVGASLLDLAVGGRPDVRPDAQCGYQAARAASSDPVPEGNVGAGAGATVGKLGGRRFEGGSVLGGPMKGGLGSALLTMPNGLQVAALVAVNAVGDVIDPATGKVVAGVRTADGKGLADARRLLRDGVLAPATSELGTNTTLGVVATNARLDKAQATKVAQMAHAGYARTIVPSHTPGDGDTIFTLATGTWDGEVNLTLIGALAAEVMADAVLRGIRAAEGIDGLPAARDLDSSSAGATGSGGEPRP